MAAKPLDKSVVDAILTDRRVLGLSVRDLADKHKVSRGAVGGIVKDVKIDGVPIVDAGIKYNQALAELDGRMVDAIEDAVSSAVKSAAWLNRHALQNVKEAMEAECTNQNDYRARADTISKAKDVVLGKRPNTAIQINNNANPRDITDADLANIIASSRS